jgi:glycosyltransferase involved in cell wall biosynthesis
MHQLATAIITTYNRADLLPQSVESILKQTWRPLELVLVDDGSTDHTRQVVETLRPRVAAANVDLVYIHKENGGISSARNEAIAASRGEFLGFLDDDDESYPHRFEVQINALLQSSAQVSSAILDVVNGEKTYQLPKDERELFEGSDPASWLRGEADVSICAVVVRRDACLEAGPFDTSLRQGEDVEWLTRLFHKAEVVAVRKAVGRYERRKYSLSWIADGHHYLEFDDLIERMLHKMRERNQDAPIWNRQAWAERVDKELCEAVRRKLYAGKVADAAAMLDRVRSAVGKTHRVRRTRNKVLKARLLALLGIRLKHPKGLRFEDIRPV